MCGPTDSSAWYDDWIKLTGSNKFKDTSGEVSILENSKGYYATEFDWPNYEPFWQQLESNAHNIQHVYFAGGEPMLIERHYDFLERCIEQDVAKNIIIEYNTNMSTLPARVTNLWKSFKQVRVGASVDGMDKMQEYQRYPAKWQKTLAQKRNEFLKNLYSLKVTEPDVAIIGVGAAAKANTFLNYYNIDSTVLDYVTDSSTHKQGKYTPLTRIPIVGDEVFGDYEKVYALILSWNISDNLKKILLKINPNIKFITQDGSN